jgi:hypothetical protein
MKSWPQDIQARCIPVSIKGSHRHRRDSDLGWREVQSDLSI